MSEGFIPLEQGMMGGIDDAGLACLITPTPVMESWIASTIF